jgi:hypothetical protein
MNILIAASTAADAIWASRLIEQHDVQVERSYEDALDVLRSPKARALDVFMTDLEQNVTHGDRISKCPLYGPLLVGYALSLEIPHIGLGYGRYGRTTGHVQFSNAGAFEDESNPLCPFTPSVLCIEPAESGAEFLTDWEGLLNLCIAKKPH